MVLFTLTFVEALVSNAFNFTFAEASVSNAFTH